MTRHCTRRDFHRLALAAAGSAFTTSRSPACQADAAATSDEFRLTYIVASCMYGTASLDVIVPQVPLCGAQHIELWAEPHGRQREELDEIGEEHFRELLAEHDVSLGAFTCFKHGIFNMQGEMEIVRRLGGDLVICNSGGEPGLAGDELRAAVAALSDELRPHVDHAESIGVTIGLENHSGCLINTRDSILWLFDLIPSPHLGLAMAPSHLPQDEDSLSALIRDLGPRLVSFQAWEYGNGFIGERPKEEQLLQLPHRGPLDWTPIVAALRDIDYAGRVEIFMHPTPRGIPIHDTPAEVTTEINAARAYLEACLAMA